MIHEVIRDWLQDEFPDFIMNLVHYRPDSGYYGYDIYIPDYHGHAHALGCEHQDKGVVCLGKLWFNSDTVIFYINYHIAHGSPIMLLADPGFDEWLLSLLRRLIGIVNETGHDARVL